jgi:hypothetical protein
MQQSNKKKTDNQVQGGSDVNDAERATQHF